MPWSVTALSYILNPLAPCSFHCTLFTIKTIHHFWINLITSLLWSYGQMAEHSWRTLSVCVSHSVMSTFCNPMDCSPPGSSVREILQARLLEWVAIFFSRGSSRPRDWIWVFCIAGRFFTIWVTSEAHLNIVLKCQDKKPRNIQDRNWQVWNDINIYCLKRNNLSGFFCFCFCFATFTRIPFQWNSEKRCYTLLSLNITVIWNIKFSCWFLRINII